MNENLIRQLYFSLQISKDLPEDVRMQLKKRIEDDFYFVSSGGKADLDHPISEELLEKTRRLFLENDLPVTAGKISSPKSFHKVGRLADEKRISFETLMVYLFGKAIPFFDKRNTALFNALSDEEDKKVLLQWLIGKYQALEDA